MFCEATESKGGVHIRRARRNVGAPLAAFGLATQPGYPIKKGVNSKDDPIRTDIWDAELDAELATSDKTVAASR